MATKFNVGKDDGFFVGKDTELVFTFPEEFSGDIEWNLYRLPLKRGDSPLVTKTGSVSAATTTTITIEDEDTDGFAGSDSPMYYHELRRTDAGSEQVLSYGTVVLRQSLSS